MNQVDLHTHTRASDGSLTPTELIERAARRAVQVVAITDHDTVSGIAEAAAAGLVHGVEVIPGIEINTDIPGSEVHILGYFIDPHEETLKSGLVRLRAARVERVREMSRRLTEMGVPIEAERIHEIAGDASVGRPHVAQALLEAGHVATYQEAFERFIGRNGPAYVERMHFTPAQACALVRRAGGVPVLAHPVFFDGHGAARTIIDLDSVLPDLITAGLLGIEAYYPGYDAVTVETLLRIARRHGLLVTGGTDFHGIRPNEPEIGAIHVPLKVVRRLREAWEHVATPG